MLRLVPLALILTLAACATAQPAGAPATATAAPAALAVAPVNDAERAVQEMITADGIHVVHFWAPWCDNSIAELAEGWYEVVEANADVDFAFVTVWSDGAAGEEVLDRYSIPDRVRVLTQSDGRAEEQRRKVFLGMPVTWLPSTWVFHENGELAYAFNWGELTMPQLQAALDGAGRDW
jgi:thiol-disulfide isomerase/thioredoxin